MIQVIISDFSRVIIFPKDTTYQSELNALHKKIIVNESEYNLYDYFYFNEELLAFYKSLKQKCKIIMFTSGTLQEHSQIKEKLKDIFDEIYSSECLQVSKSDSNAYKLICEKIGVKPNEALFIDDSQKNIDAAKQAGLQTVLFQDTLKIIQLVTTM